MVDEFRRRIKLALFKGTLNAKQAFKAKIAHQEDRCGLWFGRGECDCDPTIVVGLFDLTVDGTLKRIK